MTSLKDGVGVLLPLLLSLFLLAGSKSYASEVETTPVLVAPAPEPAPAQSETSPNLIDNNNWNGATYGADPGGCCASISGSGALYDTNTNTIMFSYGRDVLAQTIAINEALKLSGVEVDGFNYGWTWRTISNNGRGGDTLQFEVTVKDAAGNEVERYVYDYSSADHAMDVWHTESGTETFAQSYLDPQSIALRIIGQDGGFWAGYYGPEVKDVSLTLNYRSNPCAANPLYDPSCEGYADAYAQQQYDLNCQANPLYDSGCPGYQQAYYNQQCNANPLYDSGCPGYQQAYFEQQCSIDPLYDVSCSGYQQAYFEQQCSINALYDSGCTGYAQAYLDQQCGLDALYDRGCSGYDEAYAQKYIINEDTTTNTEETISATSETISVITDPEEIAEVPITGDATVDSILGDLNEVPVTDFGMETGGMETVTIETPVEETREEPTQETQVEEELVALVEMEIENETEDESSSDVDESMDSDGDKESSDSGQEGEGSSNDESSGDSESRESDSDDSEKKESKRDKLKKAVTKKAMQLAENMSNAASLEAQQAVQAQVLALINYVPDFNDYNRMMNGGYLPDAQGYQDTTVPESKRGLRNGLAQQLLHEKMVQMQYEK